MSKEEAIMQLLQLRGAFNDLSILIYDDEDKLRGKIDILPLHNQGFFG